jgi:hypothetical protein
MNLTRKLAVAVAAAAVAAAGTGIGVAAASASGPYYPQGTTVDLCIGGNDHVYAEAGRDAGVLGSCAAGYTQLPVVADPGGYPVPAPGSGTGADVVTVTNPGTQDSTTEASVSLSMIAASSQDHPISSWSMTGAPNEGTGLSINASGVISGSVGSTPGTYVVTVTATDSVATVGSTTFDWVVSS